MNSTLEEFQRILDSEGDNYNALVEHLVTRSGASGAVVWDCENEPYTIVAQHYSGQSVSMWCTQTQHENLLKQVRTNQRAAVITNDAAERNGSSPPILIAPVSGSSTEIDQQPQKLVELIFASADEVPDPTLQLNQLMGLCDVLSKFDSSTAQRSSNENERGPVTRLDIEAFAQFSKTIHQSIDQTETCLNVVNEARLLTECDRVSVLLRNGGKFRLQAISGQPNVNRRSSTVQSIENLAASVLQTGSEFWFPEEHELAPQIRTALDEYFETSSTRSLAILPIFEQPQADLHDPELEKTSLELTTIGGLVFEHARLQWESQEVRPALLEVTEHSGSAIRNALKHQSLFLFPVWNMLGRSKSLASRKTLPKTATILAGLAITCLFLAFWQTPFYVSAEGELLPAERQLIFPRTEGEVAEVLVEHGQYVKAQDTLAMLQSEDLRLRVEDVSGRLETLKERQASMQRRKFDTTNLDRASRDENLRAVQAEIDSLQRQLDALQQMQADLRVVSPIAGQVITWDVDQVLEGRIVTPQNQLMEIANTEGDWQLALELPDRHADAILAAWSKTSEAEEEQGLRVRFSLAAEPGVSYDGRVAGVGNKIQLNQDREPVLRVKVNLDSSAISVKKARAGVSAKIYTGEDSSLAALWLGGIPDAFRRHVLFYFVD